MVAFGALTVDVTKWIRSNILELERGQAGDSIGRGVLRLTASAGLRGCRGGHVPRLRHDADLDRTGADAAMVRGGGQIAVGGLSRERGGDARSSSPFDFGAPRGWSGVSIC